jgi:ABC-2 type transport system permease protein
VRQIRFIARKELYHILRDVRSLIIIFVMPVMMTFLYGYAINMDIDHIPMSIIDQDKTPQSREFTERFFRSTYFYRPDNEFNSRDPYQIMRASHSAGVLFIRPGFGEAVKTGREFNLGLTIDGSEVSQAAAVQAYSTALLNQYLQDQLPPGASMPGVRLSQQVLYNPDLESAHFFVPGLVAIILLMISALLTSITIAREKELGTMEQLLTAPVSPIQVLIGKLVPYIGIAFIDGLLVLLFAKILFTVPFVGSFLLLMVIELIYVTTALSIGILISTAVPTQQLAMQYTLLMTMLPSVMLSGFIFAIKNMPLPLQWISKIVPATYFLKVIRGIMLKGSGFLTLAPEAAFLLILMTLLLILAVRRFHTRID